MHILAFSALGFLIGNLVGLTAESVVSAILPLLFAFGGGSAIGFFHKLGQESRRMASTAILAISVACLIGVYLGIAVSEHQWLTPHDRREARSTVSIAESKYLRSYLVAEADQIDQLKSSGALSAEQAYQALYKLLYR
jgi:hypothetical protein